MAQAHADNTAAQPITNRCAVEKSLWDISLPLLSQHEKINRQIVHFTQEQIALTLPNTTGTEPVGKYMTTDQAEKFGEDRSKLIMLKILSLINSEYQRDITLTSSFLEVAQKRYEDKALLGDDQKYAAILDVMSEQVSDDSAVFDIKTGCDVSSAISRLLDQVSVRIQQSTDMESDKNTLASMAKKYSVPLADLSKADLTPEDSLIATPIYSRLKALQRNLQYTRDLIRIGEFFEISQIIYNTRLEAAATVGATADDMDKAIDEKSKTMTTAMKKYLAIWSVLNNNFPCQDTKDNNEIVKNMNIISKLDRK